ncbi:MAG: SufD family Fe-S cluster assembly protein [Bacilli bacterium]|nr:SufD family Fe-S cluster assembly protein [Bacilli bacterium]
MNKKVIDKDEVVDNIDNSIYDIKDNCKLVINVDNSINSSTFNLGNNSELIINKNYKLNENEEEITINLNGVNSRVDYNFSTLVYDNQKYTINVNHNNISTISNIINHGVVMNDSKLEFIVNSSVLKGNKKSVLNQESKIIVLSKNNSIIKPNLFIDEYDVDARHAATIGRFSSEDIFYLMTKGINKEEAIKLLINGFLNIGR